MGGILLVIYGVIPTLQQAPFARVYAAYGGIFVVLSLLNAARVHAPTAPASVGEANL